MTNGAPKRHHGGMPFHRAPDRPENRFGLVKIEARSSEPDPALKRAVAMVHAPRAWAGYPGVHGGGNRPPDGPWLYAMAGTRGEALAELERKIGQIAIDHLTQEVPVASGGRVMVAAATFGPPFGHVDDETLWDNLHDHPEIAAGTLVKWSVRYGDDVVVDDGSYVALVHGANGKEFARWWSTDDAEQDIGEVVPVVRASDNVLAHPIQIVTKGTEPERVRLFIEVVANRDRALLPRWGLPR